MFLATTERLYYSDCYLTQFEANVTAATNGGQTVYLDRTAFYPASGGQPHDLGTLGNQRIIEVVDEDGAIAHLLSASITTDRVKGIVDWPRRFDHMQQHTGQHLLSAVLLGLFDIPTVSFHMNEEVSTIELGGAVTADRLWDAEKRANEIAWEARPVAITFEDADRVEGLRKASARSGILRVVDIAGVDRSACGGTHVRSTAELAPVQIRRSEKIRGNTRIEFVCGLRAIRAAREDFKLLSELSKLIAVPPAQLPQSVQTMRDRLVSAEKENTRLDGELARREGLDLYAETPEDADGLRRAQFRVSQIDEMTRAKAVAFVGVGRAIALALSANGAFLLAASRDSGIDAGQTVKRFLGRHGGRGGGSAQLAQGSLLVIESAERFAAELGFSGSLPRQPVRDQSDGGNQ